MNAQSKLSGRHIALHPAAKPGALILGGAVGSLAAVRSLGRRGVCVWHLTDRPDIVGMSRYVKRTLRWTGAQNDAAADELLALAHRHGLQGWVLIPAADPEVRLIARHHAALARTFRLTTPDWNVVRWAADKNLTYELAERAGLATPLRYRPKNLDDVRRLDCRFPVILKPATHRPNSAFSVAKAWIAGDRTTLIDRYRQALESVDADDIVLQELIPGDGRAQFSYAAICRQGRPLAALVATRTRQYPINVGYTSTFVEVADNPAVAEAATRFLAQMEYTGAVEIEFKFDARDGTYKILDVNPRLWAWIGIGEAAGIDFTAMLYDMTVGAPFATPVARPDAAWMHLSRDLAAAAQEMMAGRLSARRYFAAYRKKLAFAVFALDDPLPVLVELPLTMYRVLTQRLPAMVNRWLTGSAKVEARH